MKGDGAWGPFFGGLSSRRWSVQKGGAEQRPAFTCGVGICVFELPTTQNITPTAYMPIANRKV